jgi:tetratricopeptide (TPR) repeat protein
LLRRRLDLDPDAPRPRLRLTQLLREAGELRAAKAEAAKVLKRAPEYAWAHFELGRALLDLGESDVASRAFERAAEHADGPELQAHHLAWAARAAPAEARTKLAARVLALRPSFVANQVTGARARLEHGDATGARDLVELAVAIAPQNLELLALRRQLESGA